METKFRQRSIFHDSFAPSSQSTTWPYFLDQAEPISPILPDESSVSDACTSLCLSFIEGCTEVLSVLTETACYVQVRLLGLEFQATIEGEQWRARRSLSLSRRFAVQKKVKGKFTEVAQIEEVGAGSFVVEGQGRIHFWAREKYGALQRFAEATVGSMSLQSLRDSRPCGGFSHMSSQNCQLRLAHVTVFSVGQVRPGVFELRYSAPLSPACSFPLAVCCLLAPVYD